MEQKDIIEKIKQASANDNIKPSDKVWLRLEKQLDQTASPIQPSIRSRNISFRVLSMVASVVILIGAFIFLVLLPPRSEQHQTVHLEDLNSIELNSEIKTSQIGDASTIASGVLVQPVLINYRKIDEGLAGKKLIKRSAQTERQAEYGLG